MANLAKKIETGANGAIIFAVVMIAMLFVRSYTINRTPARHQISVGTKFALPDINWRMKEKNVVFALSTSCHFCSESAAFYQEMSRICKEENIRTIAIFPQPIAAAEEYTRKMGLKFDEVRQASLSELEISGTPTLLLIDSDGSVRNIWVGKLPVETEKEVLAKTRS